MPLEDYIPPIDDRRFDDIMAEVRTRIARYTPEWQPVWTDVNDNDPGITMVQVFAWLAEMLTYRMSRVPELNYLKFLQLLGIELHPAEPALAEITFPIKDTHPQPFVLIPERTQVSAASPDGGPPIIFETDRAIYALTAPLASLQAFDGYTFKNVTSANDGAAQGFQPFGPLAEDNSALLLGFRYGEEFPQVEVNMAVWVMQDTLQSGQMQCGLPDTPVYSPARIRWEFWNGSDWQALNLLKDETRAFTRSGHIFLKTPAQGVMRRVSLGAVTEERYWIRARVERSQYERPPLLQAIRTNTASARQAETIRDEVLGGSNGRRDQVFRLANTPVLHDSLILEVDEGDSRRVWTRVDDFFGSGPRDEHYILNRTTGEVRFGDGENGHIPVANPSNPSANVVAREYRIGGGKRGNVPAKALQTLVTPIDGVDDSQVGNLLPAYSGRDEETLREAKKRAPHAIRSRCRAVTAEDYEYLATQAANIKRAKALPLFHPGFPDVQPGVPGVVTVIVVPDADKDVPNPTPSEATLRTVCAYLDQRRLLTAELYVIRPTYQRVEIRGEVIVHDNADIAEVKPAIEKTLLDYFHPLRGGEDGQGWPFGGTIFFSRVYQRVFTVAGVQSISRLVIVLDGEEAPECKDVPIRQDALVYSTQHDVQVRYRLEE
jgi:predicted phage baseplate assembly protein